MKVVWRNGAGISKCDVPRIVDGKIVNARFEDGNVINGPMIVATGIKEAKFYVGLTNCPCRKSCRFPF